MAVNQIFKGTDRRNRERIVPSGTQPGTPLLINTRPAVTLTARGDATKTQALPGNQSITFPNGGASNKSDSASVAFDGTYEFAVAGATTSTGDDVAVYITSAGALTLTTGSNTLYGYTDYPRGYTKVAGRAPVRIGA